MSATMSAKLLGELLLGKGFVSTGQLDRALQEQRTTGELLGALLVRKGWVKEADMLKMLGEQMGMPYVVLADQAVDWTLAGRFSSALLTDHTCFPLHMDGESLIAAIADPLDAWAVSKLEKEASRRGRKLHLVLARTAEIRAAVAQAKQQAIQSLRPPA